MKEANYAGMTLNHFYGVCCLQAANISLVGEAKLGV